MSKQKSTWKFSANNVRDFAFSTSRRHIWDAMNTKLPNGKTAMAMSMWPKEGNCLWSKFSTKAVAHTLKWFSHYTIDYPYPVAWSVDGEMGMEYPMISFNFGSVKVTIPTLKKPSTDTLVLSFMKLGTTSFLWYSTLTKRQWSWMDEGLTTFVQYLTEQQWERNFPSGRGPANKIVDYMKSDPSDLSPIMTNSESAGQFWIQCLCQTSYCIEYTSKPWWAEPCLIRHFKEYAVTMGFKTPTPADFFRTMEDASGVDLDWFWRAWFFGTQPVDISLKEVDHYQIDPKDPDQKYHQVKKKN